MTWIEWAKANGLRLNPHKSKCLVIRRRRLDCNIGFDILMNGEKIKIVDTARNLGLTFNVNLTWTIHVNTIVGKTYIIFEVSMVDTMLYAIEY